MFKIFIYNGYALFFVSGGLITWGIYGLAKGIYIFGVIFILISLAGMVGGFYKIHILMNGGNDVNDRKCSKAGG